MARPHRVVRPVLALALLAACTGPSVSDDEGAAPSVELSVIDLAAGPVPAFMLYVGLTAWIGDSANPVRMSAQDTSAGRYVWTSELLRTPRHDSLVVWIGADQCSGYPRTTQFVVPKTSLQLQTVEIRLRRTRATLETGVEACAIGMRAPGDPTGWASRFALQVVFDSVGTNVKGRWAVHYNETRRSEDGYFTGKRDGDSIELAAEPHGPYFGCDPRYTIVVTMLSADTIGSMRMVQRDGCPPPAAPVVPAAVNLVGFPPSSLPLR